MIKRVCHPQTTHSTSNQVRIPDPYVYHTIHKSLGNPESELFSALQTGESHYWDWGKTSMSLKEVLTVVVGLTVLSI